MATAVQPSQSTQPINALSYAKKLVPKTWASHDGYTRAKFSLGWGDYTWKVGGVSHTCDLRNYVLQRDLTKVVRRSSDWCIVQSGDLLDPYTGTLIHFVRGVRTSNAVQIDHVVALSNAWSTGAQKLSVATRYQIANDPMNLLAVDGPTNGSKSDSDASEFLPPMVNYQCKYVARQLSVKRKYHLWVTSSERSSMIRVLTRCPKQTLPTK